MLDLLLLGQKTAPDFLWDARGGVLPPGATFTRASSGWYFNSAGVLTQAGTNVARFDYDPVNVGTPWGFLCEPQSTNSLRNSTMVGTVAGTPGTLPTNWGRVDAISGLTTQVVGTGTENGITYLDWRVNGTPGSTNQVRLGMEAQLVISAATGQPWSVSAYARVAAGSLSNITSVTLGLVERTSSGSSANLNIGSDQRLNLGASLLRMSYALSLSGGATVTNVTPEFQFGVTSGQAIDVTFRIGLPQCEGAPANPIGVTSPIPTSGSAVTRSADVMSLPLTSLPGWRPSQGGVLVAAYRLYTVTQGGGSNAGQDAILLTDTVNNYVSCLAQSGTQSGVFAMGLLTRNGVLQINIGANASPFPTAGLRRHTAWGWGTSRGVIATEGQIVTTGSGSFLLPSGVTTMYPGGGAATGYWLNGALESLAYYAGQRSDGFIQRVSA